MSRRTMGITIGRGHIDRVLSVLQQQGMRCPIEEVPRLCPDLTNDQVFLAIACLTRNGQAHLMLDATRKCWVRGIIPVGNAESVSYSVPYG